MRVVEVSITPIAVKDPPLLNSVGVHEPFALRAIIELVTDDGIIGLSEAYGDDPSLARLRAVARVLIGLDPFDLHDLAHRVAIGLNDSSATQATVTTTKTTADIAKTQAAYEVACFDAMGRAVGRPVCDLLGGAVRDAVPYSAYLFYKWSAHPADPGYPSDEWGTALDADGIVDQARAMIERYGFGSLKLKGGVFPPDQEVEAVLALHEAFPDRPVRIDPNTAWSVATSIDVGRRLAGALEYLEDPTAGISGMAAVAREVPMPLATNMCVTEFGHIPPAVAAKAVGVVLADHHYWGGLRASQDLAGICRTFGLGLSMHSNTHLGISLAAMTHLAAATPNLDYACDTHYPWQVEDVVMPGVLRFVDGAVPVPKTPGLGVELDRDALARLHEQYLRCGIRRRDDVAAMRIVDPAWTGTRPRF